jgi:hypothetical protein
MEDENKKLIRTLEKLHLQGLIKFPNGDIMMLSKTEGERLELLEAAKAEITYNDRARDIRVNKMLSYEDRHHSLNKSKEVINYFG